MNIRINKYICGSGLYSRKEADTHVKRGSVFINDQCAKLGDKVLPGDKVTLDGLSIKPLSTDETTLIALNKPKGIVCTTAKSDKRNIVDFVGYHSRVYPVGRLDKDSQGLIFLTNRSDLVHRVLNSDNQHEKEYLVTVDKNITENFIAGMSNGIPILGVMTKKCRVLKESERVFRITLTQGLNRQIRRMCKHQHYSVEKLERVRIVNVTLNGLQSGQWRYIEKHEMSALLKSLGTAKSESTPLPD